MRQFFNFSTKWLPKEFRNFQHLKTVLMTSAVLYKRVNAMPKYQSLVIKDSIYGEFNQATKSCIFKNFNLRRKTDRRFCNKF